MQNIDSLIGGRETSEIEKPEEVDIYIKEFRIFVHAPFATNIYSDVLLDEKNQLLTDDETKILASVKRKSKRIKKIANEVGLDISQISRLINDLKQKGFLSRTEDQKMIFFTKEYISITRKGIQKLNTISYNKSIDNSLRGVNIQNLKPDTGFGHVRSYYFGEEEDVVLAKVSLKNLMSLLRNSRFTNAEREFEECMITLYTFGVGIFSAQLRITLQNEIPISYIKDEIEKKVREDILNTYKGVISPFVKWISKTGDAEIAKIFDFESSYAIKPPWFHIVYWFDNSQKLIDNARNMNSIIHRNLAYLLNSEFDEHVYLSDRYVFYGWGKSLIITGNKDDSYEQWVYDKINFIEVTQYIYSGLNLLDYFLSKTRKDSYKDLENLEDPITETQRRLIKYWIKQFKKIKHFSSNYIEHFESALRSLKLGEFALYNDIQKYWGLDQMQKDMKDNLKSIEEELSNKEQSLQTNREYQLHKTIQIFTVVIIASVVAALVELHPLKELFDPAKHQSIHFDYSFLTTEVAITITIAAGLIFFILFLVLKSHGFIQRLRHFLKQMKIQRAHHFNIDRDIDFQHFNIAARLRPSFMKYLRDKPN